MHDKTHRAHGNTGTKGHSTPKLHHLVKKKQTQPNKNSSTVFSVASVLLNGQEPYKYPNKCGRLSRKGPAGNLW